MKVTMHCYMCLLERAIKTAEMLKISKEKSLEIAKKISELLIKEFDFDACPAVLGTKREWIIAEILGKEDPYLELKKKSNMVGKKVAEKIFSRIDLNDTSYETFRKIIIFGAAANAMEWFIRGHDFSLDKFEEEFKSALDNVAIDGTRELYRLVKGKRVLYTLDNSGEAAVDLYVVRYLRNFTSEIIVAAKSRSVLNDITVNEARELGFDKVADKLIASGPYVGVYLDGVTEEFKVALKNADLLISKGMGAYETLTEYKLYIPTFILLKAKCLPVAQSLNVIQGSLVVKRLF